MKALFYFCLLLVLLGAVAWHSWGPLPAIHLAQVQPPPPAAPVPADKPGSPVAQAPAAPSAAAPAPPAPAVVPTSVGSVAAPAPVAAAVVPAEPSPRAASDPRAAAADFARRVAESQKLAVMLYPALGSPNTPLNAGFVARYRRLQAENSARLQDPLWPLQLADESAAAAGLPVMSSSHGPAAPAPVAPAPGPADASSTVAAANTAAVPPAPVRRPAAAAPANASPPLISLNVSPMNGGAAYDVHWLTFYNGYDVQGKMNRALDLDARNLSAHPSQVVLQWIFTAHKHARNTRTIFDMGSKNWDMQPSESTHFGVRSADLSSRAVWYYDYGYGRYSGSEFDGWLVIARYKDKVLKAVGSSDSLESLVGTPEFDSMVSAYQSSHPGGGASPQGAVSSR